MSNRDKPVTIDLESRDFTRLGTEVHKYISEGNPGDDPRMRQLFAYYGSVGEHVEMLVMQAPMTADETAAMPQHDGVIIVDGEPQWFDYKLMEKRILNHCLEDGGRSRMMALDLGMRKAVMTKTDFKLDPEQEPPKMIPTRTPHRRDWEQRHRKRRR